MYRKLRCFSTQVLQDLLITGLWQEKENYEKGGKFISDSELRKEFTKLRHSDEYAWLLNISNIVTKQAIKDAQVSCIRTFSRVCKIPKIQPKEDQCRSSIRTMLRYNSVIPTLSLKAFLPAGKQISRNELGKTCRT